MPICGGVQFNGKGFELARFEIAGSAGEELRAAGSAGSIGSAGRRKSRESDGVVNFAILDSMRALRLVS